MRRNSFPVALALSLALLAVVGATAPVVGASAGVAPASARQTAASCDYAALYEETIDSVVSVQRTDGQGSGFVSDVGADGSTSYVVTNAHVVGDAANVTIQFRPGQYRTGTVVGADVYSDLAVVRVNETPANVSALPIATEQPDHGERVAAFGSPLGLEETVTHGIVSGLNRSMPTTRGFSIPNVIQTDAPISPGNSGGPLVTCDGTVVGVNTAGIVARGAENIGFAVASTAIQRVVPSLVETGEYQHPTLGVSVQAVTPTVARANDLNVSRGVIVASVDEEAPAADVLRGSDRLESIDGRTVPVGGDVILAVEGRLVSTTEDLGSVLIEETRPGDEVRLTILRDGERRNVTTTVTERPSPVPTRRALSAG